MKTAHPRLARLLTGAASAALLIAPLSPSCHAQGPAPYPVQQSFPAPAPAARPSLPEGVQRLYALEGTNDLLAMATPDGYDRLRELVRNLDGDLDAIRTRVVAVDAQTGDLSALGVVLSPGRASVPDADAAKLLSALQAGRLRVTETMRITTRENTPVDTLLRNAGSRSAGGGTPFTLIPREEKTGLVTLEMHQPSAAQVTLPSGQTAVLALPGATLNTVRLLFLTPTVLSEAGSRPRR